MRPDRPTDFVGEGQSVEVFFRFNWHLLPKFTIDECKNGSARPNDHRAFFILYEHIGKCRIDRRGEPSQGKSAVHRPDDRAIGANGKTVYAVFRKMNRI